MIVSTLQRTRPFSMMLFWGYLAAITVGEYVTSVIHTQMGLIIHACVLALLVTHGALAANSEQRKLALALTLAPLIRLLSLSLPLPDLPQIAWYPTVSIPLLVATWIIYRQTQLPRQALGLRSGNVPLQIMLIGVGVTLGVLEYNILRPVPLVGEMSWRALWFPIFSLVVFTGFTEEVIFRGLLQSLSLPVLGRWAIPFVALLFGVLHIGYLSFLDVVFVSLVGLLFGYLVHWGQSIFGVTFAHGLTNVMLFLVMPYTTLYPSSQVARWLPSIVGASTIISVVAMLLLFIIARKSAHSLPSSSDSGSVIRAFRRSQGLTYAELSSRTGLSVRELAMIEHDIKPLPEEQVKPLTASLSDPLLPPLPPVAEQKRQAQ